MSSKYCYMKKVLLLFILIAGACLAHAQTTYYWVGGAASANITTPTNWNTALNGSGSARVSSTDTTDILIFDGSNLGGATPVTVPIIVNANGAVGAAQLKFVNNATVSFVRNATGTTTISLPGGSGDDFWIESGSTLSI